MMRENPTMAQQKRKEDMEIAATGKGMHWIMEGKDKNGNLLILDKQKIMVESEDFSPIIVSIEWDITQLFGLDTQSGIFDVEYNSLAFLFVTIAYAAFCGKLERVAYQVREYRTGYRARKAGKGISTVCQTEQFCPGHRSGIVNL